MFIYIYAPPASFASSPGRKEAEEEEEEEECKIKGEGGGGKEGEAEEGRGGGKRGRRGKGGTTSTGGEKDDPRLNPLVPVLLPPGPLDIAHVSVQGAHRGARHHARRAASR